MVMLQVVVTVAIAYFLLFRLLGSDYDAAVTSGGFLGFGLSSMPVAMATMDEVGHRYGPSPKALEATKRALRQGDWKLVKASKAMEPMLVNLASDPGEQKDLSAENPAKKAELTTLFNTWNASMQPPRWEDQRWNGDPDRKADKKKKKGKKQK